MRHAAQMLQQVNTSPPEKEWRRQTIAKENCDPIFTRTKTVHKYDVLHQTGLHLAHTQNKLP